MEQCLSHPASIFWDLWILFLIFQNQSAPGDVIQQIKKESLTKNIMKINLNILRLKRMVSFELF